MMKIFKIALLLYNLLRVLLENVSFKCQFQFLAKITPNLHLGGISHGKLYKSSAFLN